MPETCYEALRESHDPQRSLCRRLLRSAPRSEQRVALFSALRDELAAHAAAEERFPCAPMLMHDAGLHASRHALHEHHDSDALVEDMQVLDTDGAGRMARARKLSKTVHHHLREEERGFCQVSGKLLTAAQKRSLARAYRNKDLARMRTLLAGA